MSDLEFRAVVADRGLDAQFSVAAGEVLAVLGPNGAGKSTALHVIAGLVHPDAGLVRVGQRVLTDTERGVDIATHDRRVGLLLQNPLLFPHLNAAANVAFGLHGHHGGRWLAGRGRRRASALHWLREVDAEQLSDRRPRQLSGGQARRIAIARALAAAPQVLLLDEPLSGLDVAAAAAIRAVLRTVVTGGDRAIIMITHDPLDVLTLADRVLVLEAGRAVEIGPVADVVSAPRSRFGARVAGINRVAGVFGVDGAVHTPWGARWHGMATGGLVVGGQAVALFAPTAATVSRTPPDDSAKNTVALTVAELDSHGAAIRVRGAAQLDGAPGLAADVAVDAGAGLHLAPGEQVWFLVDPEQVRLHPAERSH